MGAPKYYQIENLLREEIEGGRFEPGDRFYSNTELVERFGVSSITVIRAVGDLVAEGLLVRQQGKGTFVSRSRRRRPVLMSEIEVFSGEKDEKEQTEVLSLTFLSGDERDEGVVATLGLGEEDYCVIERVRSYRGTPFQFQTSYIPARFIRHDVDPSYYTSIYRRFREDHGIHLSRQASQEFVRVCVDVPARVSECLCLREGTPCVHKNHTTTLIDGTVAEYIEMYKRWDYFEMMIEEVSR